MNRPPVIGISCYVEPVSRGDWVDQVSVVLPLMYARHVERAGGVPVVLPPRQDLDPAAVTSAAAGVLAAIDGLVIAGGADIESARYGAEPHLTAQAARPDRDAWELALARESRARGIPTLGVCRGMQVMAVADGGALEQHVPDRTGTTEHSPVVGEFAWHPVTPVDGSQVAAILGPGERAVPTYHHQAVLPASLASTGYAPAAWHADGTLEAMEDAASSFRLAVQWHPEAGDDNSLFAALVAAATSA